MSPSKRARTRYRVTRHDVALAPAPVEPTDAAPTSLTDDTPLADIDLNAGEYGAASGNAVYIHEDDVPESRRSHVSFLFHALTYLATMRGCLATSD